MFTVDAHNMFLCSSGAAAKFCTWAPHFTLGLKQQHLVDRAAL